MTPLVDAPAEDHELAQSLAEETAKLLLEIRGGNGVEAGRRIGWGALEASGDREAHLLLERRLAAERPRDGFLSEEGADDRTRLGASRVWIVDPLDGSYGFSTPNADDWAVHVALTIDGAVAAGAVALPSVGVMLSTASIPVVPEPKPGPLRIVMNRSSVHWDGPYLADALDAEIMAVGSAGVKAATVMLGSADAYVHSSGLYEWDSCAPVAVARAAGLHCSRLDGAPLTYNNRSSYAPGLLICRPEVADDILAVIASA